MRERYRETEKRDEEKGKAVVFQYLAAVRSSLMGHPLFRRRLICDPLSLAGFGAGHNGDNFCNKKPRRAMLRGMRGGAVG